MTSLDDYLATHLIDPTTAMNLLQDHGIISDNAIATVDVANPGSAVSWLHQHPHLLPRSPRKSKP